MFLSFYNVRVSSRIEIEKNKHPGAKNSNFCIKRTPAYPMVKHIIY